MSQHFCWLFSGNLKKNIKKMRNIRKNIRLKKEARWRPQFWKTKWWETFFFFKIFGLPYQGILSPGQTVPCCLLLRSQLGSYFPIWINHRSDYLVHHPHSFLWPPSQDSQLGWPPPVSPGSSPLHHTAIWTTTHKKTPVPINSDHTCFVKKKKLYRLEVFYYKIWSRHVQLIR